MEKILGYNEGLLLDQFHCMLTVEFDGYKEEVERLLPNLIEKISPDKLSPRLYDETLLHILASYPKVDYEILFKNNSIINVNVQYDNGITPLHIASASANERAIKVLLAHGASIDLENIDGVTPLLFCLFHGCDIDSTRIVKLLANSGAQINHKDKFGQNPLHIACWTKNIEAAKFLISQGCDINAMDKKGRLPTDVLSTDLKRDLEDYLELIRCR